MWFVDKLGPSTPARTPASAAKGAASASVSQNAPTRAPQGRADAPTPAAPPKKKGWF